MSKIAFSLAALTYLVFAPAQAFANEPVQTTKQESKKPAPAAKKEDAKQPAKAGNGTTVELETSEGKIRIALDTEKAPVTTKNFVDYVEAKFYDGTVFHRIIDGFMIQGGGYTIDGGQLTEKKTNPPITNEAKNGLKNDRGTIAMARTSDPNSATAQFFINHVDNNGLNFPSPDGHGYAVFGKVVDGMDVVDKIAKTKTAMKYGMADVPEKEVKIISAKVVK